MFRAIVKIPDGQKNCVTSLIGEKIQWSGNIKNKPSNKGYQMARVRVRVRDLRPSQKQNRLLKQKAATVNSHYYSKIGILGTDLNCSS